MPGLTLWCSRLGDCDVPLVVFDIAFVSVTSKCGRTLQAATAVNPPHMRHSRVCKCLPPKHVLINPEASVCIC